MSQKPNPIKAYTRATHTVAKTRQVVMLYDGAIRFLKQAAEAMEQGAIEERYQKLTRVSDIISGLQNSLDFTAGGSTAQVLFDFYASIDARIFGLHRQPSADVCNKIIQELKDMRDVWDGIDRGSDDSAAKTPAVVDEDSDQPTPPSSPVKVSA